MAHAHTPCLSLHHHAALVLFRVKELRGGGGGGGIPVDLTHYELPNVNDDSREDEALGEDEDESKNHAHMQADLQYLHRSLHKVLIET